MEKLPGALDVGTPPGKHMSRRLEEGEMSDPTQDLFWFLQMTEEPGELRLSHTVRRLESN